MKQDPNAVFDTTHILPDNVIATLNVLTHPPGGGEGKKKKKGGPSQYGCGYYHHGARITHTHIARPKEAGSRSPSRLGLARSGAL